jgi:hypothetical protein
MVAALGCVMQLRFGAAVPGGLLFATGCSLRPWPSVRDPFATGSAVLSCVRQVGAVLGIAGLVALLDAAPASDPVSGFLDAYR